MSIELLDKTRSINYLLQSKLSGDRIIFNDLCNILCEDFEANVLVISKKGKVLGVAIYNNEDKPADKIPDEANSLVRLIPHETGKFIDKYLNQRLNNILSTKENVNLETLGFTKSESSKLTAIVTPILISGERLGHLFIYKKDYLFSIDDIILSEYGASVIGLETMRSEKEQIDKIAIKKSTVESAIASLSLTEIMAIKRILKEIPPEGGIIVTSKIATEIQITRSIIVNAISKFISAGIFEAHSSGMKGTYIKVINNFIYDAVDKL